MRSDNEPVFVTTDLYRHGFFLASDPERLRKSWIWRSTEWELEARRRFRGPRPPKAWPAKTRPPCRSFFSSHLSNIASEVRPVL